VCVGPITAFRAEYEGEIAIPIERDVEKFEKLSLGRPLLPEAGKRLVPILEDLSNRSSASLLNRQDGS
jgi:hypothetical protein